VKGSASTPETMFKILSIDGGGIRGVFAARFLERCEETWRKLHETFDLIIGTSTGGIIALAAAYEKPMSTIVKIYSEHAAEIFPRHGLFSSRALSLFRSKYDNRPLILLLKGVFGSSVSFDIPSCAVRVQSFDLETGASKIFRAGGPYVEDAQFRIWEVAAATSAAPTYFPTFAITDKGLFVDGGIWANNPSLVGMVEALILHQRLEDVCVLSVGTGDKIFRTSAMRTGFLSWRSELVDLVFQAQSDGVHQLVKKLEARHLRCYKRISESLKDSESSLDAIHTTKVLRKLADRRFEDERAAIECQFFT
jgi:patatin-like phospholipase/acyl hydrolase